MGLVVICLIYYFSLFVPKFDLVYAVDAILIPLKQLKASQIVCENMNDDRENAICSCICIYNMSEKKSNAVSSLHRLCIAPTSSFRSYIATKS